MSLVGYCDVDSDVAEQALSVTLMKPSLPRERRWCVPRPQLLIEEHKLEVSGHVHTLALSLSVFGFH